MSCNECETRLKAVQKQLEIQQRINEDLEIILRGVLRMEASRARATGVGGFPFLFPPHFVRH